MTIEAGDWNNFPLKVEKVSCWHCNPALHNSRRSSKWEKMERSINRCYTDRVESHICMSPHVNGRSLSRGFTLSGHVDDISVMRMVWNCKNIIEWRRTIYTNPMVKSIHIHLLTMWIQSNTCNICVNTSLLPPTYFTQAPWLKDVWFLSMWERWRQVCIYVSMFVWTSLPVTQNLLHILTCKFYTNISTISRSKSRFFFFKAFFTILTYREVNSFPLCPTGSHFNPFMHEF